jgi:hypothetical protein
MNKVNHVVLETKKKRLNEREAAPHQVQTGKRRYKTHSKFFGIIVALLKFLSNIFTVLL